MIEDTLNGNGDIGAGGGLGKALTNDSQQYPEETIVTVSRQALEAPDERVQRIQVKDYSEEALNTVVMTLKSAPADWAYFNDRDAARRRYFPGKEIGRLKRSQFTKLM